MESLESRFPDILFYNAALTEVQTDVQIGKGTRVGSFTLFHKGAIIGEKCAIGSHCNICECVIGHNVSIQTGCHITRGVVIEDSVFIGPGVITLNDKFKGRELHFSRICRGAKVGGGCVILPGIVIGENAVIGAGSIVTRNVSAESTIAGNPAREHFSSIRG